MAIFPVFDTASSALSTNRIWMDAIADNLANVNTIKPFDQPAFQARFVEAQELPSNPGDPVGVGGGVTAAAVKYGSPEGILHSDPGNPLANKDGMVRSPDVRRGAEHDRPDPSPTGVPTESRGHRPRARLLSASHRNQRAVTDDSLPDRGADERGDRRTDQRTTRRGRRSRRRPSRRHRRADR